MYHSVSAGKAGKTDGGREGGAIDGKLTDHVPLRDQLRSDSSRDFGIATPTVLVCCGGRWGGGGHQRTTLRRCSGCLQSRCSRSNCDHPNGQSQPDGGNGGELKWLTSGDMAAGSQIPDGSPCVSPGWWRNMPPCRMHDRFGLESLVSAFLSRENRDGRGEGGRESR